MAEIINMPRLSDTMEEGVVAKWLKKVGDKVEEGDILAEIETDKATMEFESFHSGTLLYIGLQEGETAPVDSLLAIIGDTNEDISSIIEGGSANVSKEQKVEAKEEVQKEVSSANSEVKMPDNLEVITMPRLSDTMTEGTVATWLKKIGDKVEEGDILAEIETDKATMEFESFHSGTLLYIGIKEGESAPVDEVLAIIGEEGADVNVALSALKGGNSTNKTNLVKSEDKKETPKKLEEKVDTPKSSVPVKKIDGGRIFASPLARKIAEDKGISLDEIQGTGENGRIIRKDVENYKPQAKVAKTTEFVSSMVVGEEVQEEVKNSQMRKTIAKRLSESKFTAPHYYLTVEIDMDNAMVSRKKINELPNTKVSFNDLVVKACAMALKKHPQVNTSWKNDVTVYNKHVSIGVAVAIEDGLVVPVLKFTDQMTLSEIGVKVKELAGKARDKKLTPAEMEGSTFTVSNLGMFGIEEFTSIINQPNSAILSVGAIIEKPIVKNGQIVIGHQMKVTLACDHRTVDGATGAQFLQTLKMYIENPVTMLV